MMFWKDLSGWGLQDVLNGKKPPVVKEACIKDATMEIESIKDIEI